MSAVRIRLTDPSTHDADAAGWATKREAAAALAALRDTGRNTEPCVQIHPAVGHLRFRWWVIARPDPAHEFTWLMRGDGSWLRGRLYDDTGKGALWQYVPPADGQPLPATITHNYRYSGGYVEVTEPGPVRYGLLGQPIPPPLSYLAKVWCVACTWKAHSDDEHGARAYARTHRANPGDLPLRTAAGRLLHGQIMPGATRFPPHT
jgi:hypothetical protein